MQIPRANLPRLVFVLVGVAVFVATLDAQRPFVQPEVLSGEWETTTASGVHGVHLQITTYNRPQTVSDQSITIRVYHRQNGQEKWGWWGDNGSASTVFDGERLRVADLDVTFDSHTRRWTGTWFLDGELNTVVLEKPTCQTHPLCGTWEGRGAWGFVRLHLVQSTDGVLTAWMDRAQRHGEHLRVVSSEPSDLRMETTPAGGFTTRFAGRLSDQSSLEGDWNARSPGVDTRQTFHRVQ
jgi:hypothetical protein